jgi:hypothetical protein
MTKDILTMYGPDSPADQMPRATNGGKMPVRPIPYSKPMGPANQMHEGPGLAESTNHGCCGTQGKY